MKFTFKDPSLQKEFYNAPLILQYMAEDFIIKSNSYGIQPVITRVLEKIEGDSGVHEAYRGIDFRDEYDGQFVYPDSLRDEILSYFTAKWYRNDNHLTLMSHSFEGGPRHFHLQLAESTLAYWIK